MESRFTENDMINFGEKVRDKLLYEVSQDCWEESSEGGRFCSSKLYGRCQICFSPEKLFNEQYGNDEFHNEEGD